MRQSIAIAVSLLAASIFGYEVGVVEIIPEGTDALQNPCQYGKSMSEADLFEAATNGNADAQFALARRYCDGDGVAEDCVAAFNWFKMAAEQGHVKAQCCLGQMYEGAGGVVSNFVEAAKWYRAAAEQGYAEGQRRFGALRRGGMGVEKNVEDGLGWYRKAAMQGDIYAAHELGDTYRFGDEVEPDIEEAMKWYSVAAEHGDPIAKGYCKSRPLYYPRTFPASLGLVWAFMVYPVWWMFCLLRLIARLIMDFIPTFAGRMKPKFRIVLPWWLALVGFVLCCFLLSDDWLKAWGKHPGLVVSTALCCLSIICLHWIKQRQLMKSAYVHVLIALSYLLLWTLPEIHYAIFG